MNTEGNTVVIGPPGTGKTHTIEKYVNYGAEKFGPERILVCSLTKTAAQELTRKRKLQIPRENIGTLHAICYRDLGQPPLVYNTLDEFNAKYGYRLSDATKDDDLDYREDGDDYLYSRYDLLRMRMTPKENWKYLPGKFYRFIERIEEWKKITGTVDFTDMIKQMYESEHGQPSCKPKAIFYDEAQDGSALELALIKKWSKHTDHTIIAGDEDQALFEWRGASVKDFLNFSDRKIQLKKTYRLSKAILDYSQEYARQIKVRVEKVFKTEIDGGIIRNNDNCSLGSDDVECVVNEAWKRAQQGKEIMLLATCGYLLGSLITELKNHGIPFHNPFRQKRGDWNPIRRGGKNISATDRLLAFLNEDIPTCDDVYRYGSVLSARGIINPGYKSFVEQQKGMTLPMSQETFRNTFEENARYRILSRDLDWFRANLVGSKARSFEFPIRVAKYHGKEYLEETPKITVGTIHSVKGGECDCVFLFPDLSAAGEITYRENRDPVLRTFYVGMTRAREEVILCAPATQRHVRWP